MESMFTREPTRIVSKLVKSGTPFVHCERRQDSNNHVPGAATRPVRASTAPVGEMLPLRGPKPQPLQATRYYFRDALVVFGYRAAVWRFLALIIRMLAEAPTITRRCGGVIFVYSPSSILTLAVGFQPGHPEYL